MEICLKVKVDGEAVGSVVQWSALELKVEFDPDLRQLLGERGSTLTNSSKLVYGV